MDKNDRYDKSAQPRSSRMQKLHPKEANQQARQRDKNRRTTYRYYTSAENARLQKAQIYKDRKNKYHGQFHHESPSASLSSDNKDRNRPQQQNPETIQPHSPEAKRVEEMVEAQKKMDELHRSRRNHAVLSWIGTFACLAVVVGGILVYVGYQQQTGQSQADRTENVSRGNSNSNNNHKESDNGSNSSLMKQAERDEANSDKKKGQEKAKQEAQKQQAQRAKQDKENQQDSEVDKLHSELNDTKQSAKQSVDEARQKMDEFKQESQDGTLSDSAREKLHEIEDKLQGYEQAPNQNVENGQNYDGTGDDNGGENNSQNSLNTFSGSSANDNPNRANVANNPSNNSNNNDNQNNSNGN